MGRAHVLQGQGRPPDKIQKSGHRTHGHVGQLMSFLAFGLYHFLLLEHSAPHVIYVKDILCPQIIP